MYACMYVCRYVCMYVYMCIFSHPLSPAPQVLTGMMHLYVILLQPVRKRDSMHIHTKHTCCSVHTWVCVFVVRLTWTARFKASICVNTGLSCCQDFLEYESSLFRKRDIHKLVGFSKDPAILGSLLDVLIQVVTLVIIPTPHC